MMGCSSLSFDPFGVTNTDNKSCDGACAAI